MNESIGVMAGKVWHALNENGNELTVAKLKSRLKADAFSLNAAIGWLAREDKVNVEKAGNSYKVSLKD
ncbi:MAG: hypothetical protein D6814_01380 [Calditrichaeota bacterium]|nr:MAG: hypothetical protein D6814_01380 [Calditrichota bacterium]